MWPVMHYLSIRALQADATFVWELQCCDESSVGKVRQTIAEAGGRVGLMGQGMSQAQVVSARLACARVTARHRRVLQGSVGRVCGLAVREDCKAGIAGIFGLLADGAGDPVLRGGAGYVRELTVAVGRVAGGMIVSSRRLLVPPRAGDGEGAALETEGHLRVPRYMTRPARGPAARHTSEVQS